MPSKDKPVAIPLDFDTAIGAALLVKPPAKAKATPKPGAKKAGRKPKAKPAK